MSHWESNSKSDDWYTPKYIFDALECEFDLDVAHPGVFDYCCVPAKHVYTVGSLNLRWDGFVWMNPPFGKRNGITPWLNKINLHGNGIALTPDRTSCPWWQLAAKQADSTLFINGKVKFIKPDGTTGDQPSNGTTLFAYGIRATLALKSAERNGLGIVMKRSQQIIDDIWDDSK